MKHKKLVRKVEQYFNMARKKLRHRLLDSVSTKDLMDMIERHILTKIKNYIKKKK